MSLSNEKEKYYFLGCEDTVNLQLSEDRKK